MDLLKNPRKTLRSQFTRLCNELSETLGQESPDKVNVQVVLETLIKCYGKIEDLDQKIIAQQLADGATETEQDTELQRMEEYERKFRTVKIKTDKFLERPRSPSESESSTSTTSAGHSDRHFKLPKFELKKFDGGLREWLGFWSQFRKIHEDENIPAADKFQYLSQSMVRGSRAQEVIEAYPQSAENYHKAITALKTRFGKEELLVEVYVRELLKLVINNINNSKEKLPVTQIYDKLESHLRALESLGVTSEKYAAMLFPLVESALHDDILRAWQRSSLSGQEGAIADPKKSRLCLLMEFLSNEVQSEERIALARSGFDIVKSAIQKDSSQKRKDKTTKLVNNNTGGIPTAMGLYTSQDVLCIFCEKNHDSQSCVKAQQMNLDEKKSRIMKTKSCFVCFKPGHLSRYCKSPIKCILCAKRHNVLMCPQVPVNKGITSDKDSSTDENVQTAVSSAACSSEVVMKTLMVNLIGSRGKRKRVRAFFDSGSQRSYILQETAKELGIQPSDELSLKHTLFGGETVTKHHNRYRVKVENINGSFVCPMVLLDVEQICAPIPRVQKGPWMETLKRNKIWLSDLGGNPPKIEVLIGLDTYDRLITGRKIEMSNGLTATETKLGWTLSGEHVSRNCNDASIAMQVVSMFVSDASIADLWKLETIGIQDPSDRKSAAEMEEATRNHFLQNVRRSEEGRYSVGLPWICGVQDIPDNRNVAEKRLVSTTKKLVSMGKLEEYGDVFKDWRREEIIEEVPETECRKPAYYLPHHAVLRPDSLTTPIRPVFDASCKSSRNPSLNDCLEKGPNLTPLLPDILHRFREGRVGVVADIRKAFQMIEITKEDKDFLRFLWWKDPQQSSMMVFRHCRVVFGVNCSPFHLVAVLQFHLNQVKGNLKPLAEKLLKSFYVDNCVTSVDTMDEAQLFRTEATKILAEAKMELRQWGFGSAYVTEDSINEDHNCATTTVLGLQWDQDTDTLRCELPEEEHPEEISKRTILSWVQRVFDPLGFLCPTMLIPKLILQETWISKTGWDQELCDEIKLKFKKWCTELQFLQQVVIPRNVTGGVQTRESWELHTFCDASQNAYASVIFLRTDNEGETSIQLLQAKSRVAPLKKTTIPRLELLACCIGARLTTFVKEALSLENVPSVMWTDSTTALAWIKRNDEWGTFVGNRVKEICQLTKVEDWRYVQGAINPADLPSRGCSPSQLLQSRWWEGPDWLYKSEDTWPSIKMTTDEQAILAERKKRVAVSMNNFEIELPWYARRFSSYIKNVRVIAWVNRFLAKARRRCCKRGNDLTVSEIQKAEETLLSLIQRETLPPNQNVISGLRIQKTEDGLIRVKTKLIYRDDTNDFRLPVLLPHSHPTVDQIIREEHLASGHAGIQYLMGHLRERFWIIQGRKAIRKIVSKCPRCLRFTSKARVVPAAPLPEDRVKTCKVFEVIGVDLGGPLFLQDSSKVWFVLFTCAVFRCIHLELVTSLSTEGFLLALRRFINRRGRPGIIYSDNGTNFVGTNNLFKGLDWKKIETDSMVKRIQWRFNPPASPWWAGFIERMVRSVKDILKRILGKASLNYEELNTCLCDAEAIVNGRPLTVVTEDPEDLIPLTPMMFLQDNSHVQFPEQDAIDATQFQRRLRYRRRLREELHSRFRKEYLSLLVQRSEEKGSKPMKVGDVVLVGAENKKRVEWPLGRILELIPGRDGIVRVVRLKTASGTLLRPVKKIYPLEISSASDIPPAPVAVAEDNRSGKSAQNQIPEQDFQKKSRFGRTIRSPERFGL